MDAGFGSLTQLKQAILPVELSSNDKWDDQVKAIGLGIARQFEGHCDRKFSRAEGATYETSAACFSLVVDRYPVEQVMAAELSVDQGAWQDIADAIQGLNKTAGLIHFSRIIGRHADRIRVTFDGGWWWDTTEDASGVQPAGSALIPSDIVAAWFEQAQFVCERRDIFKTVGSRPQVAKDMKVDRPDAGMAGDLLPSVKGALNRYRRFS